MSQWFDSRNIFTKGELSDNFNTARKEVISEIYSKGEEYRLNRFYLFVDITTYRRWVDSFLSEHRHYFLFGESYARNFNETLHFIDKLRGKASVDEVLDFRGVRIVSTDDETLFDKIVLDLHEVKMKTYEF